MKMLLVVPVMGRLHETKPVWGTFLNTVEGPIDLMVIDNSGDEGEQKQLNEFFNRFIVPFWPGTVDIRYMDDNIGVINSMQYAYENSDHDILAFLHNDLYIYDSAWDWEAKSLFVHFPYTGLVGFFGAEALSSNTGRAFVFSNMLEAEIHGGRHIAGSKEVAVLDGMCMIASRRMLDVRKGVDTAFDTHHFYDLDLSLESIDRGYRNFIVPIHVHHQSGVTACGPNFQEWANQNRGGERAIYDANRQRFIEKWGSRLPYRLGVGWGNG